ncbi:sigma-54-dependent Fis family transcriptional regulator [Geobacter sp. FeAm09]|uniref:sigma 54-interacting transcriptional regulator n=1 Tax=Geobacter sp. FeAm09 TaxID=2597769 RepID=UPI0011EBB72A|nr:sigma 54-interacting transcriptional regulator [Geobacter sp. FeAm09]QEM67312.1 sigma-54-dependent Fis family transcriptional regulator [Geobacter sp. FeAm09]
MNAKQVLSSTDREFFKAVTQASIANPFSQARVALDRKIAGTDAAMSWDDLVGVATARVSERLAGLKKSGRDNLQRYGADDQSLLRTAFLFDIFHRHRQTFDDFILRQLAAGDTPIPAPFARELLSAMSALGIDEGGCLRFLGIFYQIRRAFYFIETSLIGLSPSMHGLRLQLWNNIFTCNINWYEQHLWNRMEDFSTLLLGETGTGKGAAAAAIGRSGFIPFDARKGCFSESFTRNFIAINLSQYPESLLESELFGHKKGAFTGAIENHEGVFSRCTPHGSIFLDEIGDVSVPVQIKLLQVIQERTFAPVGSHERQRFQGRVIAATNRPLDNLRRAGQFRDDFYYRLCSDIIVVPPLKQRIQEEPRELEALIVSILKRMIGDAAVPHARLVQETLSRDLGPHYSWPGNVRELEQAVRRIIITRHYRGDTDASAPTEPAERLLAGIEAGSLDAQQLMVEYCGLLYKRFGTYEEVARTTGLDRRTVKKYVLLTSGKACPNMITEPADPKVGRNVQ